MIRRTINLPFFKLITLSLVGVTSAFLTAAPSIAATFKNIDFLGEATFATGTQVKETELGGLSGITYDASKNVYRRNGSKAPSF